MEAFLAPTHRGAEDFAQEEAVDRQGPWLANELLMALSGRQLPPGDMSAVGDKADLRQRRAEVG